MFVSCSQHLEIFFLPAVPTEHLDRKSQPQIPMTLRTVPENIQISKSLTKESTQKTLWKWLYRLEWLFIYVRLWHYVCLGHILHYCTDCDQRKRAHISAPIILSKLLELAKWLLADPSSMERIMGAEIHALFLWSVHAVMLDVV